MKVLVKNKYRNNTMDYHDIHCNKKSLKSMIMTNSKNIKNPVKIDKEDNVKKLFNKSISRTILKERQLLSY